MNRDEEPIFAEALELADLRQRAAYLDRACVGNPALHRSVESLLSAYDAGEFLEAPAVLPAGHPDSTATVRLAAEAVGGRIGPYKLLEQIGEGGMGLVFVAEQTEPVKRRVALKVIKPGMDTKEVIARFEAERQALALMGHANIAQVFDAGTTDNGRPYFVMELVRGLPITDYCDQARLPTADRLKLFVRVCRAVQHAHQKGVIHRDLKPNNILITLHDGEPVPKVIDFGVAKAVNQRLTAKTVYTRLAQLVGTPLYMSPEQAEMSGLDVDTRSDVYSLGVLLYELLTGTTPFEPETLKQVGFDEMRRLIREEEPPMPSRRLNTLDARACSTVSERRGVDGRHLGQLMRGELDWVVMRALEKDRDRRYESANALAADVERYQADEPVEAGPPSAWYRARKYVRRHRRLLAVAGLFAVVLLVASAVSIWQAVEARKLQRQAQAAEGRAATEAAIAQAVNDFLRYDLLRQVDKDDYDSTTESPNLTVREALDRASARIGDRFQDQPLVEAAIRATIGDAYRVIGESAPAMIHYEKTLALRRVYLGADHPGTLDTMHRLAIVYGHVRRPFDGIALQEECVARRQAKLGPHHKDTLKAMGLLVEAYQSVGQLDKALLKAQELLELRERLFGSNHPETIEGMRNVAVSYDGLGRLDDALALYQTALSLSEANSGPHPTLNSRLLNNYAMACYRAGRIDEAERLARLSVERGQRLDGIRAKVGMANAMSLLAFILLRQERYAEAEANARRSQELFEKNPIVFSGPNDVRTSNAISLVGGALLGQKRYTEAEPFLLRGYEGLKKHEPQNRGLPETLQRVIQLYEETNQPEKAREWRERLAEARPAGRTP